MYMFILTTKDFFFPVHKHFYPGPEYVHGILVSLLPNFWTSFSFFLSFSFTDYLEISMMKI